MSARLAPTPSVPAPLPAAAPPMRLLDRLAGWHAVWLQRKQLSEMDATRLADIGLTPADVAREVARPILDAPAYWLK